MKLYAVERMGRINNLGKSIYFKGIINFDAENCAIKCNKAERKLFDKVGFDLDKENMDGGSMWITPEQMMQLKNRFTALQGLKDIEQVLVRSIVKFITICIDNGYYIRAY